MEQTISASPAHAGQRVIQERWIGKLLLLVIAGLALFFVGGKAAQSPQLFVRQIVNGLQLGFVYALIALGYTMVYGIVRLINFAHGDVFMVGAFTSFFAISRFQLHLWPAAAFPGIAPGLSLVVGSVSVILVSMVVCAIMAVTIERVAYKPLRNAPRISALITAIGVSFFLEYFGALPFVYTSNFVTYQRPFPVVTYYISDGIHRLEAGTQPPPGAILFSNIFIIIVLASLLLLFLFSSSSGGRKLGRRCGRSLMISPPLVNGH
jgi:branched-chain amino acid transport system permease protein